MHINFDAQLWLAGMHSYEHTPLPAPKACDTLLPMLANESCAAALASQMQTRACTFMTCCRCQNH